MKPTILLVEDDENLNYVLTHFLEKNEMNVLSFTAGKEAIENITTLKFDAAVIDVNLGNLTGFDILNKIKKYKPNSPVIMITAYGNVTDAVKAIKNGAYDYLVKPFKEIELVHHIQNALKTSQLEMENIKLKAKLSSYALQEEIVGESASIKKLRKMIKNVARSDVNVFISGETGVGKELVARAIHKNSPRSKNPFVAINCAAIPDTLIESELFGYVKGAFTGAIKDRMGKFELANNGTIFLDEITEMPYHLQAKLLRVIQEKKFEPVGSNKMITINVRFISASNKNVEEEIKNGRFREDLFYRLSIFPVNIPPLREHKEDIPLLIEHFARKSGYGQIQFTQQALNKLFDYNWPGNVRELENLLHYLVVIAGTNKIDVKHLPEKILNSSETDYSFSESEKSLADYEREIIINALKKNNNNKTKTAKQLKITRAVLLYKMKKLGIE